MFWVNIAGYDFGYFGGNSELYLILRFWYNLPRDHVLTMAHIITRSPYGISPVRVMGYEEAIRGPENTENLSNLKTYWCLVGNEGMIQNSC